MDPSVINASREIIPAGAVITVVLNVKKSFSSLTWCILAFLSDYFPNVMRIWRFLSMPRVSTPKERKTELGHGFEESPRAYIFQRPFLRGLSTEVSCVSKTIGLALYLEGDIPFLFCFTLY